MSTFDDAEKQAAAAERNRKRHCRGLWRLERWL